MSLPGWVLPTFVAAIIGLGLFGANSYFNHGYLATNTRSASSPVTPILSIDDEGQSPAPQPGEASTATSLPAHTGVPSSESPITFADSLASEAMETAWREPIPVESDKLDEAVEGDGLLPGAFGERANFTEGSVSSEGELSSLEPTPPQSIAAYSRGPAQTSVDSNTGAIAQEVPTSTSPPDAPTSMEMPSPLSPPLAANATLPQDRDAGTGGANGELKRVLLVEDSRALGENLVMALKDEPDIVVVGQTGSPAECDNFVSAEAGLDVAIVVPFLLDDQGFSLIEGLRRFCPHVPMLVLAPSLDPSDQERVMKAGADTVLAKDADPEQIVSTVRSLSPS